jgi:phosphoribosylformylglycinamidine synthase
MFKIEVCTKLEYKNAYAEQMLSIINETEVEFINKINCSFLYTINGDLDISKIKMIATELLTDKVTEQFYYKNDDETNIYLQTAYNYTFLIEVWYKDGVTDTVAETVLNAVKDLGIVKKISVKRGYKYYLYSYKQILQETLNRITRTCLCNVLIQDYIIKKYNINI